MDGPAAVAADGEAVVVGFAGAAAGVENESDDPARGGDIGVYRLQRSGLGWSVAALTPAATRFDRSVLMAVGGDAGMTATLWGAQAGTLTHKENPYLRTDTGEFREVGPGQIPSLLERKTEASEELALTGASNDLSTSLYTIVNEPVAAAPVRDVWPEDTTVGGASSLYEYRYRDVPNTEPALVGVRNDALPDRMSHVNEGAELISRCGTELGSGTEGSAYNAVSEDGSTVFFTAVACAGDPAIGELYARIDGARTVAISEPSKEDCIDCNTTSELRDARFAGASTNGQKTFFMSEQSLFSDQSGMNLYEYDFAAPTAGPSNPSGKVIPVAPGPKPEVQGVVRISEDGSHVYFVAKGVLAGANAEGHAPQAGADNLYVYEPDPADKGGSRVVFIAVLLTPTMEAEAAAREETIEGQALAKAIEFWEMRCPPAFSQFSCIGEVEAVLEREKAALGYTDIAETLKEDRDIWRAEDVRPAQTTPDGRFLIFMSSSDITADDSSNVPQLFEYDAQGGALGEGALRRVSIGQDGYDSDGNVTSFRQAPQIPSQSFAGSDLPTEARFATAVSDDGSRVFFTSAAPLTPLAASGSPSLFEYREGEIYLISDGSDTTAGAGGSPSVQLYGTTPSGSDVFFTTSDQLVPQAPDTQQALYDAREEGGFPAPSLEAGCLGETCRGFVKEPPSLASLSSQTQAGEVARAATPAVNSGDRSTGARNRVSRARALTRALKACERLSKRHRQRCRAKARRRYGQRSRDHAASSRWHTAHAMGLVRTPR